jgi:hypothetical protein
MRVAQSASQTMSTRIMPHRLTQYICRGGRGKGERNDDDG